MSVAKLRISPFAILLLAAFVFVSKIDILLAVFAAIGIHELGHFAAIRLFGGRVQAMGMTIMGLEMRAECLLSYLQEMLALLAGPLANVLFFLLFGAIGRFWNTAYLFGGAHLMLGLFNLLPIRGLDGSDLLWIGVAVIWDPNIADRGTRYISMLFTASMVVLSGFLVCRYHGGVFLLLTSLALFLSGLREIGVVKWARKR